MKRSGPARRQAAFAPDPQMESLAGGLAESPPDVALLRGVRCVEILINPLAGRGADSLFSTHPATHNRVEALLRLGVGRGARLVSEPAVRPSAGRVPGPWG